jgi:hypothetical protein
MSPDDIKALVAAEVARIVPTIKRLPAPEYMNPAQAAAFTGYTEGALEILRQKGKGPRYLKDGRSVRYTRADLHSWMADWEARP